MDTSDIINNILDNNLLDAKKATTDVLYKKIRENMDYHVKSITVGVYGQANEGLVSIAKDAVSTAGKFVGKAGTAASTVSPTAGGFLKRTGATLSTKPGRILGGLAALYVAKKTVDVGKRLYTDFKDREMARLGIQAQMSGAPVREDLINDQYIDISYFDEILNDIEVMESFIYYYDNSLELHENVDNELEETVDNINEFITALGGLAVRGVTMLGRAGAGLLTKKGIGTAARVASNIPMGGGGGGGVQQESIDHAIYSLIIENDYSYIDSDTFLEDLQITLGREFTQEELDNINTLTLEGFGAAFAKIGSLAAKGARSVGAGIATFAKPILQGAGKGAMSISKGTGSALASVGGGTGKLVAGAGKGVGSVASGVGKGAASVGAGVGKGAASVGAGVGKGAASVGAGAGKLASGTGSGVGSVATGAGKAVSNTGSRVGGGLSKIGKPAAKPAVAAPAAKPAAPAAAPAAKPAAPAAAPAKPAAMSTSPTTAAKPAVAPTNPQTPPPKAATAPTNPQTPPPKAASAPPKNPGVESVSTKGDLSGYRNREVIGKDGISRGKLGHTGEIANKMTQWGKSNKEAGGIKGFVANKAEAVGRMARNNPNAARTALAVGGAAVAGAYLLGKRRGQNQNQQ